MGSLHCEVKCCVCDREPPLYVAASTVQIMVRVSKMWKQGRKSGVRSQESTLTSETWKNNYASPEYQAFYCFQCYLMPDS